MGVVFFIWFVLDLFMLMMGISFIRLRMDRRFLYMDLIRVCFNSVLYKYKFEGGGGLMYDIWFCIIMLKLLELIFLWNINMKVFFI